MAYSHELLIDQETGELDRAAIKEWALVRARADFGSSVVPDSWVRQELLRLHDIALILRRRWRAAHGLPDDTEVSMVLVPTWGGSGDGYGREV